MSIESVMPSNHLVLSHPLLAMPSVYFKFKVFSKELALPIRWPKYWSFSFSISSSKEYSGLISFRINCFDLLTVQQTLQRLLQHCDAKESIVLPLSLLYGPTLTSIYDYFSSTVMQKNQFFATQPCLWSNSHLHIWLLDIHISHPYITSIYDKALTSQTFVSQVMSLFF